MFTVTRLARARGLSRGAVPDYEPAGLLRPPRRSSGNCRPYSERDLERLRQICVWRGMALLKPVTFASFRIGPPATRLRFCNAGCRRSAMRSSGCAAGMSDEDMRRWHAEFEKAAPAEHQEFEFLRIPAAEIRSIRDWSRARGP